MAELELLEGVRDVPRDEWDTLVRDESPFLEWDWLASLEEAGVVGGRTGWVARPLVARVGGRVVAAAPLYVKSHSQGEFVFDHAFADAAERAGIRYYPKLVVGVPFTPVAGARILVRDGEPREAWVRRLGAGLTRLCRDNALSSVHVNFCREDEIEALRGAGFALRLGVQYQWRNHGYATLEDYLAHFRSKRRNQIRRELRSMDDQEIEIETLAGDAIPDSIFPDMFRFYRATLQKKFWGQQYLNEAFFDLMRERFKRRLCFVVARHRGRPIGGTFNVQKGSVLYGRYWGATEEWRDLHFNVAYYAAIRHCIEHGLERFEPGAGGEFKRTRGFDAQPTWSLHYMTDPRLFEAVVRFLEHERREAHSAIEWCHENSALKHE
jgi:hypothetical protein